MDFLERQQITFFIITGLTELWSRTGPCFERRFDFVVGDIVDSTYLTDRFFKRRTELGKTHSLPVNAAGRALYVILSTFFE